MPNKQYEFTVEFSTCKLSPDAGEELALAIIDAVNLSREGGRDVPVVALAHNYIADVVPVGDDNYHIPITIVKNLEDQMEAEVLMFQTPGKGYMS